MTETSPYMDENDAGAYIRVAPGTLKNWRSRGLGPPYLKIGGLVVYHRPALNDWMLARTVIPVPRAAASPIDHAIAEP
jgi:hypothetical protein